MKEKKRCIDCNIIEHKNDRNNGICFDEVLVGKKTVFQFFSFFIVLKVSSLMYI